MNFNKTRLTVICYGTNLVSAGFFTTMGLLVGPLSEQFGIDAASASRQFTWFTGSYFAGSILSFFVLDHISARSVLFSYGLLFMLLVLVNTVIEQLFLLSSVFCLLGIICGISVCAGSTVISLIWSEKYRQSALIGQDAAFNVGGIVFPLTTAYMLERSIHWGVSYIPAVLPAILFIYLILISSFDFESDRKDTETDNAKVEWNAGVILAGIFLFLVVTSKYITVIWLPNYAETSLNATPLQSGELIARLFGVALVGSVVGAIVVSRVNIMLFAAIAVLVGFLSSMQFTAMTDLEGLMLMVTLFGSFPFRPMVRVHRLRCLFCSDAFT